VRFRRRSLPGVEIARLDCTGHAFAKHAHDEFVIGANLVGRERIWLDGRTHEAEQAQVTVYNPGQVQSSGAGDAPWSFVSLYLEPDTVARLAGLASEVAFDRPILWAEPLADEVRFLGALGLGTAAADGEVIEAIAALVAKLLDSAGSQRPGRAPVAKPEVRRVTERLRAEMAAPPGLEELAAGEGLTPVQLVRAFTRAHGLPPFAWLNLERLKAARRALTRGGRLSHLAVDLGFADQAHLTRRFKAVYGVPPGAWARGGR
jgi:AraC family transcriptional regulator, chemosensory pili system protein ChpD